VRTREPLEIPYRTDLVLGTGSPTVQIDDRSPYNTECTSQEATY
jgi:hypothetical protein